MEMCHRPPPGVAPRPCPAPSAPALLFVSLRAGAAEQPVASENPAQACRERGSRGPQNTARSGHRKKTRSCLGASASAQRRPPRSPSPRPRLRHSPMSPSSSSSSSSSMFSRTFLVIICMSPRDRRSAALGSTRLRSARAASSAQPSRHCPAALRLRSASAGAALLATEHAQRDAAAPAPDQTAPAARSPRGSRAGGVGGRGVAGAERATPRLRGALQPQRQAGFQELTRVFKLICRIGEVPAYCVGGKTTHVHTESPSAPARGSTRVEWSRGAGDEVLQISPPSPWTRPNTTRHSSLIGQYGKL